MELSDPTQSLRDETTEFLTTYCLTKGWLASQLDVSRQYVSDFLSGRRGISLETAKSLRKTLSNPSKGVRITNMQVHGQPTNFEISHCERVKHQVKQNPNKLVNVYREEQL